MLKPANSDIFGHLVYDRFKGDNPEDIIVHSDLCDPDSLPQTILFRDENNLFEIERVALNLCEGKVLDVGAGTGCLSYILARKGFEVDAIDLSQGCVDFIQSNEGKAFCVDFFDFDQGGYDTLLFMMNGIGITGTLSQLPKFFSKSKELLNPGGKILLDSSDIAYMFENEDGSISINLNQEYYGEVKYQMQYKDKFGDWFDWLYIDFDTLAKLAEKFGFRAEKIAENNHHHFLAELKRI